MEITDLPLSVLRFQYQMARVPFQVMEEQFVAGISSQAPARLFYEHWLGALDTAAGMVLRDPELKQRGAALAERSDALGRVAQLDATATRQQEQAADELKTKRDKAKQGLKHARATKQREVDGSAERLPKTAGGPQQRLARSVAPPRSSRPTKWLPSVSMRPKQPIAKSRPRVGAGEENATKAAESDRNDAQTTRSDAATQRAQADQVENWATPRRRNATLCGRTMPENTS